MKKYLWKDGKSAYRVLLPEHPTPTERHAAEELVAFIGRGLTQCIDDGTLRNGKYISLGDTSLFRASRSVVSEIRADGYFIRTWGESVILYAPTQSGILNSVYGFMRAQWGFKAYSYDEFNLSESADMPLKELSFTENPSFIGREVQFGEVIYGAHPYYASRLRLNGVTNAPGSDEGSGTQWCRRLWAHTALRLLPKEKYYASHPEYYSEDGGMICLTNDAVAEEVTKNLIGFIEEDKNAKFFAVTQSDGYSVCKCEKCKIDRKKYKDSGMTIRFTNRVAKRIEEWKNRVCPEREIYIVTFAYQYTLAPPVKKEISSGVVRFVPIDETVVARSNVVVRLAPLYNCFRHDILSAPCNKQFRNALLGWHAISERISLWTYAVGFGCYMVPFNDLHSLQRIYRTYKQCGCIDVLVQGSQDTQSSNLSYLRIFLHSELLWNPEIDFRGAVKEFCEHFYRAGAPYMLEYIRLIQKRFDEIEREQKKFGENFHARPTTSFSRFWERGEFFPKPFLQKLLSLLGQARAEVIKSEDEKTKEKVLFRLKAESLTPRYLLLMMYSYGEPKKTVRHSLEEFDADCRACGLTHYREHYRTTFKIWELKEHVLDGSCFNIP